MVGLQTLDLAIGVRVPASQPFTMNKLRAAHRLPVLALYHYCVTALVKSIRSSFSVAPTIRLYKVLSKEGEYMNWTKLS